jgi:hypothetical protein
MMIGNKKLPKNGMKLEPTKQELLLKNTANSIKDEMTIIKVWFHTVSI